MLAAAKVTEQDLRAGKAAANQAVLDVVTGQTDNGTGILAINNVFANLAINPFPNGDPDLPSNRDCWIVNREVTPLPDDENTPASGLGDYTTALSRALIPHAVDTVRDSRLAGRVFDFLSWATDINTFLPNVFDIISEVGQAARLTGFATGLPDALAGVLAFTSAQAVLNELNALAHPDRGQEFLADVLTGFVHALEGTGQGRNADGTPAPGQNSDRTGVSHRVGAIDGPGAGYPDAPSRSPSTPWSRSPSCRRCCSTTFCRPCRPTTTRSSGTSR